MSVSSQVDVQSPPWDDMGPLSAGRSSRALTPPSQAVAPVTGVSVRGGRFNNSASANNNFSLSLFNLVLGPRDNAAPSGVQSEFPSSTYSRLLLPKACGFPLYDPQPPGWLNSEYRLEGVRIGDVGIVTTEDHPINRGGVPDGFSPPQWARNVTFLAEEDCRDPGDYVINGSVQAIESDRTSGDYRFKGTAGEAGVLVIPAATVKAHAPNTRKFRDYAAQNAVTWYKFGTEDLGRDAPNGSIYLITGWEKTRSWGTASFQGNKHDFELVYRNKVWAQYGSATAKRGPRGANVEDPPPYNQCIFLNGYKATLGERLWDRVLGTVQVSAVGNTATQASSSGSSMATGASLGGSLARWLYPSGQTQGGSGGQSGLHQNESNMVILESINPATSEDVHPSNLINRFLLSKFPEADVAITHDDVWCSLMKDPHLPFQDQIESLYTINSRNGAAYLTKKPRFATDDEGEILSTYIPIGDSPTLASPTVNDQGELLAIPNSSTLLLPPLDHAGDHGLDPLSATLAPRLPFRPLPAEPTTKRSSPALSDENKSMKMVSFTESKFIESIPEIPEEVDRMPKFNAGRHYGPVLDPALLPRMNKVALTLNPLIQPAPTSGPDVGRPHLKWNMLYPSLHCHRSTHPSNLAWTDGRHEPATWPRVNKITLTSHTFPGVVKIDASDADIGVTCADVIEGIGAHMFKMVPASEYKALDPGIQKSISEHYAFNRSGVVDAPGKLLGEGLRRLDFLGNESMFGGIVDDPVYVKHAVGAIVPATFVLKCITAYPPPSKGKDVQEHRSEPKGILKMLVPPGKAVNWNSALMGKDVQESRSQPIKIKGILKAPSPSQAPTQGSSTSPVKPMPAPPTYEESERGWKA